MSEVGIICIVLAVALFGFGSRLISKHFENCMERDAWDNDLRQEIAARASGKYIEYTRIIKSKKKGSQEIKTAISISKILSVSEEDNGSGGAFIITRDSSSFFGRVYGHATKESYEEIMQRIRAAESETIFSDINSEDKEKEI